MLRVFVIVHYILYCIFFHCYSPLPALRSFPTRRSSDLGDRSDLGRGSDVGAAAQFAGEGPADVDDAHDVRVLLARSEEHTSELQSRGHLVCRLLLEKKK